MSGRHSARVSTPATPPLPPVIEEMSPADGNAFAHRDLQRERYQLAGNAFAQQEFARRKLTPPGMTHPAFRPGFNLLDTTQPLPELDPAERQAHVPPTGRESTQTAMGQFMQESPEIDLGTTPEHTPLPTQREWLESRDDFELHGNQQPRIAVIKHTPKISTEEFAASVSRTSQDTSKADPQTPGPKSPKKSFLERVSKWTARRSHGQSQKQKGNSTRAPDLGLPPKARAVLQEAPPPRSIIRSPSKTRSVFSRRNTEGSETPCPDPPRAATSLCHRTPRSVHFSTPDTCASQSRQVSGSSLTQRVSGLGRSQSLKYIDHSVPPTPPAKDTPPDEPPIRNVAQQRPAITHETPSKPGACISSGRLSPGQIGSSVHRGAATLVTQPSTFSLRASVVPSAMCAEDFDDAKSRLGGLGIEGFSMPHETHRDTEAVPYSPSIYSPDQFCKSAPHFPERTITPFAQQQYRVPLLPLQTRREGSRLEQMRQRGSPQTGQSGSSDTGTISMIYPELAKDPSIASFMTVDRPASLPLQHAESDRAYGEVEKLLRLSAETGLDGSKESSVRGRGDGGSAPPKNAMSTPTSAKTDDSKADLFALPLRRSRSASDPSKVFVGHESTDAQVYTTPAQSSPMARHPSAIPSPLRDSAGEIFLPQTTYCPPAVRSRKGTNLVLYQGELREKQSSETLLSPYDPPWTPGGRPKPKEDIFKTKPSLVSSAQDDLVIRQSPPMGGLRWSDDATMPQGDPHKRPRHHRESPRRAIANRLAEGSQPEAPNKPLPEDPESAEDFSDLVEMITERDNAIQDLQTEIKFETTRLHHRLASLEIKGRESAPHRTLDRSGSGKKRRSTGKTARRATSTENGGAVDGPSMKRRNQESKRISTSFARDFYHKPPEDGLSPADSIPMSERSTIILTPNLPQLPQTPELPQPSGQPREDSPTLPPGSPCPAMTPEATVVPTSDLSIPAAVPPHDSKYTDLVALIQQQQAMMLDMMQEIKDLKRAGTGGDGSV